MRRSVSQLVIPCLALAVAMSPPSPAASAATAVTRTERGYEVVSRKVNFADLDLTRKDGVAALYARIKSAANEVCDSSGFSILDTLVRANRCKRQAIDQAVEDVHSTGLTRFHMATTSQAYSPFRR